jgi:mannose-1-phosphate guanylyltransferase
MKGFNIVVFCGGVGTRLWPLSRQEAPKQFQAIVGEESLLQNAVYGRLRPDFPWERIFISTGARYFDQVKSQLPEIPEENFILEPEMRDTAAAVGYAMLRVMAKRPGEPAAVLWQDHLVRNAGLFKKVLSRAAAIVASGQKPMVYLGVPPRYPSVNLGYIEIGRVIEQGEGWKVSAFAGFTEKPDREKAKVFLKGGKHLWNPGYFVCDPGFLLQKFAEQRDRYNLYDGLMTIKKALGTDREAEVVRKVFADIDKEAIDYVVHERMGSDEALVISADFGWSDIGEWRALKEALEENPRDNIVKGEHLGLDSEGCLIYGLGGRLVATVGLRETIVVDTEDVVLVCAADQAPRVKELVKSLRKEKRTEYL